MTILITGGTGKTGILLAHLLQRIGYPVLLTSRTGKAPEPFQGVLFDWLDSTTHINPFTVDNNIDRVYLVGPPILDMLPPMKMFIDLAVTKGVRRFVLLSGTASPKGGLATGQVHEYLAGLGMEYCVLRPSWFFQNFTSDFLTDIRDRNIIASATGRGRIPFVSTEDIAEVACRALVDKKSHNTEHLIFGPELYSYDEVAGVLTEILGREITHKNMSIDEAKKFWMRLGMPEDYANATAIGETTVASGQEEAYFHSEIREIGRKRLRDYLEEHKELWE